jgi:hypothetical protein
MSLADLANLAETVGIFAILFGIAFGVIQLRQGRIQRRELAILECARSFEDEDFTEAYRLISELPPGMTKEKFDELGAHYEAAAIRVGMKFETMGLLVHRGVIPLDAMSDLVGGAALTIWKVMEPWCEETREFRSHPTFWEWYQWLVERLQERGRSQREPVYLTEANWKEPKI